MDSCVVMNCIKPIRVKSRGLCDSHYQKYKADHPDEFIRPDSRLCIECGSKHYAKNLCRPHYLLYVKEGKDFPSLEFYKPNYRKAHRKVVKERGPANSYLCICGCGQPAVEWALKVGTVDYLIDEVEKNCKFSLNVWDYQPMAVLCHRRMDLANR
jgi:hypothetical protein